MKSEHSAIYRDDQGTEVRIPAVEKNGTFFLELKCGLLMPVPARIGNLTLVADLGREKIIAEINEAVYRFPEAEFESFLSSEPEFREAFKSDFAGLAPSKIIFLSKRLSEAAERLEVQRLMRLCGESRAAGNDGTD
jgi:hypothetical protein